MLSNVSYSLTLLKHLQPKRNIAVKCFSTVEALKPVKLSFAAYETPTGSSKDPPFVILHGLFGSKQNWTSLSKAYHQKTNPQRKVIAIDLRNHGDSPHNPEHSYEHLTADLKQFLDDHDIRKIALMGHSMGGRCAMFFALSYPKLVEKLIVVDISPVRTSPNLNELPNIFALLNNIKMPSNVSLSQARTIVDKQLAEHVDSKSLRSFLLTNLVELGNQRYNWRINISSLSTNFALIATFPNVNDLHYNSDTLFVGGTESDYIGKIILTVILKRNKSRLVKYGDLSPTTNLAYASYQSTESTKTQLQEKPLVLIHGILCSKANFHTLCKRYHEHSKPKRLVYAVDLRNHGDSIHDLANTYDDLVMDVVKFLHAMHLKKVTLIGHDIGGRVGMLFALKYPELVDNLIVSDISPVSTSQNFKVIPDVLRALNSIYLPKNMPLHHAKALVATHMAKVVKEKGLISLILANLVQTAEGSYLWRFNLRALINNFDYLASFPELHNVSFVGPVLFIGGAKSDYIQKSDYPKIKKLFPKAELKFIEGAGHWVHSEKPNDFLKVTLDFLNEKGSAR